MLGGGAQLTQPEGSSGHTIFDGAGTTNRENKESSDRPRLLTITAGGVVINEVYLPRAVGI